MQFQIQTSSSYSGSKDASMVAAVEKAKEKVQQMVKRRNYELANIDSEPLHPTYKKSRVVPKSSTGVLTESVSSQLLEDDNVGTDTDSKKKLDSSPANSEDSVHHIRTNAEDVASESQKNDAETSETNKPKKSLPFIGKLPFLKAARGAKQAATEQSAADDKSKIEIKLNVSQTVSTPVQSEPALSSSDAVITSAQEQTEPTWSVTFPRSDMKNSGMDERNSLDAFLSIGDPESGQSQAVPVLNVGPQTRLEFMSENEPDEKQTSSKTPPASNTLSATSKDAEVADSNDVSAAQCGKDDATVSNPPIDVKAANTDKVMGDVKFSGTVPTSSPSNKSQTDDASVGITGTSTVQITDTEVLVSEPDNANASSVVAAADTDRNTDQSQTVKDRVNNSTVSVDADDNTEDYEPEDNAETEQVAQVPRDEKTAELLPQISAAWMQPAASGYSALSSCSMYPFNFHTSYQEWFSTVTLCLFHLALPYL